MDALPAHPRASSLNGEARMPFPRGKAPGPCGIPREQSVHDRQRVYPIRDQPHGGGLIIFPPFDIHRESPLIQFADHMFGEIG
jgi:hypothetical protein